MTGTYCVVGGGISGLVAAYRIRALAGPAATIRVFDPADRLGGVLRTETLAGQVMDIGAEAFIARRPEVPALLEELGLADRLISPTGVRTTIYSQGRLHPLPTGTVNGIPGSAQAMTGLVDRATVDRIAAESDRPLHWESGGDPAVGAVVADRFGEQVVTRSLDPLLSGVYAGSAATIGIRSAVPTVAAALDAGASSLTEAVRRVLPGSTSGPVFGAIEGGYRVLLDELIARARLDWIQAPVTGIAPESGSLSGGWNLTDGTGAQWHTDAVVVAVAAAQAAALLGGIAPRSAAAAARVPIASAAILALALPAGTPFPPQSGVLVATGEALHCKAITLSTRKWGGQSAGMGQAELLRMSFGRFGDTMARSVSDEDLLAWALEDLNTVFGIRAEPVDMLVHRWIDALPQYGPGHGALAADVRADLPPGVAITGNYLDGVGVPACVAAAGRAAAAIVAR